MNDIWVSRHNQREEIRGPLQRLKPVRFYDTTLRDGEQTVGVVFTPDEKVDIARRLSELGVSRIEAGFPKVSEQDTEAFSRILSEGLDAEVWGFSRALVGDLDALIELGVKATIIEVPTSTIKLEAYGLTPERVLERATTAISHARDHGMKVCFFPVDGTRTALPFLREVFEAGIQAGAEEVAVVDTIGACSPEAVEFLVGQVCSWVGSGVSVHFHGHNDFGLATASAIAAVRAGADWIQGTINGMGERAGNADIGEVATALHCLYEVPVALDLSRIREVSETVRTAGEYELEAWKPVVGGNLFTRESGAVAAQFHIPEAIEPFSAEIVQSPRRIVLGKKSGLANIDLKARELGLRIEEHRRGEILAAVKLRGVEKKGLVSDEEFREMVGEKGQG